MALARRRAGVARHCRRIQPVAAGRGAAHRRLREQRGARVRRRPADAAGAAIGGAARTRPLVPAVRRRRLAGARRPRRRDRPRGGERRGPRREPRDDGGHHRDGRQLPADRRGLGGAEPEGRPVRGPGLARQRRARAHGVESGRGRRARPPGGGRRRRVPHRDRAVREQPDLHGRGRLRPAGALRRPPLQVVRAAETAGWRQPAAT